MQDADIAKFIKEVVVQELAKPQGDYRYFHLSSQNLGNTFLFVPRIPTHPAMDWGGNVMEDDFTPRISLATSIAKAQEALQGTKDATYVYATKQDIPVVSPRVDDCPEYKRKNTTGGTWTVKYGDGNFRMVDYLQANKVKVDGKRTPPPSQLPPRLKAKFQHCVNDVDLTQEVWSLVPVELELIGVLKGDKVVPNELEEANSMASGAVDTYTGPLGMDPKPGHKLMWSGDEPGSDKPKNESVGALWESEMTQENVLDAMGQRHVGGAKRKEPYGDTYVGFSSGREEDHSGREKQAGIVKKVNKNLQKKPYTLHDPPSMGISITRPSLKDRK
jgi:hypothetical protein